MAVHVARGLTYMRAVQASRIFSHFLGPQALTRSPDRLRFATSTDALPQSERLQVTFVKANGEKIKVNCKEGDSLLDAVVNNEIDIPGYGACEGTLTCSTCHVILSAEDYEKLPTKPTDDENDMLDLAYDLTDTSRLGCQIVMTKELNGLEVKLPTSVNDARK